MIHTLELAEEVTPGLGIVKLNITDQEIQNMKDEFMVLKINGIDDRAGLRKVYESRQLVKRTRVSLEKHADELKETAVAWQKKVNSEKKRVVNELELIETYLQNQEDFIAAEKEVLRVAEIKREQERIQKRIDALAAYGYSIPLAVIESIDDATFEKVLSDACIEHEKDLAQKAEEKRLADLEAQRLIDERKELEKLREQQAASQKIIDQENERIRREQEQKEATLRAEQEKIDDQKRAAELQRLKAIAEKKRADELKTAQAEATEKERLRMIEQQRLDKAAEEEKLLQATDKVKFQTVITQLGEIKIPEMKSAKSKRLAGEVTELLAKITNHILSNLKQ